MSRASGSPGSPQASKCTCNFKGASPPTAAEWNCVEAGAARPGGKEVFVNAGYVYPAPVNMNTAAVSNGFPIGGVSGKAAGPMMPVYSQWNNRFVEPDTWSLQTERNIANNSRRLPSMGGGNNVIVNPLPPFPASHFQHQVADLHLSYPYNDLVSGIPSTKQLHPHNQADKPADSSQEQNTNTTEDPIYQEIGMAVVKEKINNNNDNTTANANSVKQSALPDEEQNNPESDSGLNAGKSGLKKEIEYWQITAKEVVKFRPCTETFIHRNNV